MSVGGVIGAFVGGAIGFFIGGPAGMVYGASIGFSIGMVVDPLTPDISGAGTPVSEKIGITPNELGMPVADLLGTGSIRGNLLFFGKERSVPIYTKSSGGKGGGKSKKTITGYEYYITWGLGLCSGPVDEILSIWANEDCIWSGHLKRPASGGKETIILEDIGSATICFGTQDQTPISAVGDIISDSTLNTPYRGLCWIYLNDYMVGKHHRMPTIRVVLRKTPEISFNSNHLIQDYDYNPIHAIWYILHNLTGLPESWLNTTDFSSVANVINSENRGISILFGKQQAALNYIENINQHIDGITLYGNDGKFHPKLIRDDYVDSELLSISEDNLLEEPIFNRPSWIDTINEVKVQYSEILDRESYYKVLGYGYNISGELGQGDNVNHYSWNEMYSVSGLYQIGLGWDHVVVLKSDGTLWGTGSNSDDELGLSGVASVNVPTQIGTDNNWAKLFVGFTQTFAIKKNGTLWGCGWNSGRQLGVGTIWPEVLTQEITYSSDWKEVGVGWAHTIAVKNDGTLWGAGGDYEVGLDGEGTLTQFTQVGTGTDWDHVKGGDGFSIAIKEDGTLWGVGSNTHGELGLNNWVSTPVWTQESLGYQWKALGYNSTYHSVFAIRDDGTLWSTGLNNYYQLGFPDTTDRNVFTQVGGAKIDWTKVQSNMYSTGAVDSLGDVYYDSSTLGLTRSNLISDAYFVMDYLKNYHGTSIMVAKAEDE